MFIKVAFDGKPLFTWKGTAEEMLRAEAAFEELADEGGVSPISLAQGIAKSIGEHGGDFLPMNNDPQMWGIAYLFLTMPTGNLEHPGQFRDHLHYDFDINIHPLPDRFRIEVHASSWLTEGEA